MFTAIVLMCAMADPTNCYEFTDRRGPYPTTPMCEARVGEMISDLTKMHVEEHIFKYQCKVLGTST